MNYIVSGVKCDERGCGWKDLRLVDARVWLNKPCPKCNKGSIIVKEELEAIKVLRGLEALSKLLTSGMGPEQLAKAKKVNIHAETIREKDGKITLRLDTKDAV